MSSKDRLRINRILLVVAVSWFFAGCSTPGYEFEFTEINTPGTSSLRAICAVDENTIWVSGSMGRVFLSSNGGESWKQRSVPDCENTEFRSLHAWDALRALVFDVSPEGRAFLTQDGGFHWKKVYQSPVKGAFFNSLKFADDRLGMAISDPIDERIFILKTVDGGRSWIRLENTPPPVKGEINFAASNTCVEYLSSGEVFIVTGGSRSRILSSKDHGMSWKFTETSALTGESAGLFSVNFLNPKHGVAVGGDFNDPAREGVRAIYTTDGGESWFRADRMPAEYRSCVVPVNEMLLFATGKTGCDYSADRGRTWTFINSRGYYAASALQGKNMLFLCGPEGRVAKVIVRK